MLKNILDLIKNPNEFVVGFDNYEQACELLKFLEDNTDIVWMSGDSPTTYCRYFESNDYYLEIGRRLSRRENWIGTSDLRVYKYSELLREPPKCFKRL